MITISAITFGFVASEVLCAVASLDDPSSF
jgi:hypothetical protein